MGDAVTNRAKIGFILACFFLDALGVGLIVPVLPRLIGTLSETRDAQTLWYGAIMVSYGLMQFLSSPVLGSLSDRLGRRPVLLTGIFGLGITFAVPAFFASLPLILASRIIGGALSSNISVAQAYIADITAGKRRAMMFGRLGAAYGIGFVVGPALGGIAGETDPTLPFLIASVLSLCNFLFGFFFLPESLREKTREAIHFSTCNAFLTLPKLLEKSESRPFFFIFAFNALAIFLLQCTWALYTEFRYGFTPLEIGLSIFALGVAMSVIQGYFLSWLLTFCKASKIVFASLVGSALSLVVIGLTENGAVATIFCCAYAIGGTVGPILTSVISQVSSPETQGKNIGALNSLSALMSAVAPVFGTVLLSLVVHSESSITAGAPYFAAALLMLCALYFFGVWGSKKIDLIVKPTKRKSPEKT